MSGFKLDKTQQKPEDTSAKRKKQGFSLNEKENSPSAVENHNSTADSSLGINNLTGLNPTEKSSTSFKKDDSIIENRNFSLNHGSDNAENPITTPKKKSSTTFNKEDSVIQNQNFDLNNGNDFREITTSPSDTSGTSPKIDNTIIENQNFRLGKGNDFTETATTSRGISGTSVKKEDSIIENRNFSLNRGRDYRETPTTPKKRSTSTFRKDLSGTENRNFNLDKGTDFRESKTKSETSTTSLKKEDSIIENRNFKLNKSADESLKATSQVEFSNIPLQKGDVPRENSNFHLKKPTRLMEQSSLVANKSENPIEQVVTSDMKTSFAMDNQRKQLTPLQKSIYLMEKAEMSVERANTKVEKASYSVEKTEDKLDKVNQKLMQKRENVKLYEKARPSAKLHDVARPSEKLILEKKRQLSPEEIVKVKNPQRGKEYLKQFAIKAPERLINEEFHNEISKYEEDNIGLKAAHQTEIKVEQGAKLVNYHIKSVRQRNKLRPYRNMEQAEEKVVKSQVRLYKAEQKLKKKTINYQFEQYKVEHFNEYSNSSTMSKWQQKRRIKKKYAKQYRLRKMGNSKQSKGIAQTTYETTGKIRTFLVNVVHKVANNPSIIVICLILFLVFGAITTITSFSGIIVQGIMYSNLVSTYTANDEDLLEVEEAYCEKEAELKATIDNIETTYPDYDEYVYDLVEIGHNPYDLAALLTVLYHAYTLDDIETELQEIFDLQYQLTIVPTTETRYLDDGTPYDVSILTVTLTNTHIETIAQDILTDDELKHFELLQETKGNKPDIFGDYNVTGGSGSSGDLDYTIPDYYLSDANFAALMQEAEKYLGYPYVWGGSSPSTSFDCSGFVCYVLKASGVWDISRTTAQGIFDQCTTIPSSERQAGDIIFFTGTYNSAGAVSHVGIYVGDGMMIHCGDPISYASVDSGYWTSYFYAYGRIP